MGDHTWAWTDERFWYPACDTSCHRSLLWWQHPIISTRPILLTSWHSGSGEDHRLSYSKISAAARLLTTASAKYQISYTISSLIQSITVHHHQKLRISKIITVKESWRKFRQHWLQRQWNRRLMAFGYHSHLSTLPFYTCLYQQTVGNIWVVKFNSSKQTNITDFTVILVFLGKEDCFIELCEILFFSSLCKPRWVYFKRLNLIHRSRDGGSCGKNAPALDEMSRVLRGDTAVQSVQRKRNTGPLLSLLFAFDLRVATENHCRWSDCTSLIAAQTRTTSTFSTPTNTSDAQSQLTGLRVGTSPLTWSAPQCSLGSS